MSSAPASLVRGRQAVHAWLMLLPALVLLVAFTHWPAVATLIDSLHACLLYTSPSPRDS